ncbi:hypothetical protein ALI144C_15485 [Actinosynnema sp. ALI-1.44]|uniref:NUDIX hydrolase n=1 Tax=Actinosynnema sp. ALI-1.44 TaxID=1933779 RepID=UPI00097CA9E1|nr:NUDIX domain-containing protein [Actinosynnema sp. ALI-1.44]ONI84102.1 hypothetical protein ALI144C_15485 [Actinosynnema sp. ALI-1.44]
MDENLIETVGLVHIRDRRMLLVRGHGKHAFYLPGGKIDPGEDDETALTREIMEELGCAVVGLRGYRTVAERAYGQPDGTMVAISCYFGELDGDPAPMAEIAQIGWFTHGQYARQPETAPAALRIMDELRDLDLIA